MRGTSLFVLMLWVLASSGWSQSLSDDCLTEAARDYDKAIRFCSVALGSGHLPNYELVHSLNSRGWAYYRKGDYDHAIQDYNEAIQLKPDYAFAFNNRGLAYSGKRDYDRAIDNYTTAIELKPDYAVALKKRGVAYFAQRDNERALQD